MASETDQSRKQNHLAGIVSIVVAVQVISFSDAAAKYLSMTLPLLVVLWGRFFFHALFTGVYVGLRHGPQALNPVLSRILLARGAALFVAVGLLYATGVFYAVFLFLTRYIERETPPIVSVFHTGLVGAVAASVIVLFSWQAPAAWEWGLLMFAGGVAAIAHIFIIKSFEKTDASVIAPYTYSEIVMAAILGYLVFGDRPDIWLVTGCGLIVASGIIVGRHKTSE